MNPHDLHYIFFTMAVKTICQSGTQFSTFYSHLTFPNHFQNFNMIIEYFVLLSYLKSSHCCILSSNSTYLFISKLLLSLEYRERISTSFTFLHFFCPFSFWHSGCSETPTLSELEGCLGLFLSRRSSCLGPSSEQGTSNNRTLLIFSRQSRSFYFWIELAECFSFVSQKAFFLEFLPIGSTVFPQT